MKTIKRVMKTGWLACVALPMAVIFGGAFDPIGLYTFEAVDGIFAEIGATWSGRDIS